MAPKTKLHYFNSRGRGELLRQIMTVGGLEFEDRRIEFQDWQTVKPTTPEGVVPYIELEGKQLGETIPLARFLGKRCKLMGQNEFEEHAIDTFLSNIEDLRNAVIRIKFDIITNEEQKKQMQENYMVQLGKILERWEKILTGSKCGFLVGDALSVADLAIVDFMDTQVKNTPDVLTKYPKVTAHRKKVAALPKLVDYLTKRLDTAM